MEGSGAALLRYIEQSQIGYDAVAKSSYGAKPVVYADYTASGRSLSFIEDYISREVLPFYGNTHTTTSFTSKQSTHFREEARCIIKEAVNCCDEDALIFVGSGCTGAVHKLVHCLSLQQHQQYQQQSDSTCTADGPVVFVGPFEHHSNILPWRELPGALVLRIRENAYGEVDIDDLHHKLQHYSKTGRQLIGAFNAASNITGVLTDTDAFSSLLHQYGALALWDYATAGPYLKIDMNPTTKKEAYKDAVYFSMHKFVGGPDTPGVLIAKKNLFRNKVPQIPGGGTVQFQSYHSEPEEREEGGTPSIVGAVRAGLAMQLKEEVGSERIMRLEEEVCGYAFSQWEGVEELMIVGPRHIPRLPIFSFLVRHPHSGLFLHHYFVSALLNDLFGIQARGGCSCAGPYGQALLDISEDLALDVVMDGCVDCERELTKPGMTRLSFPYFMSREPVDYIIQAVTMVAKHGWKLLHQYTVDPKTGSFSNRNAGSSESNTRHLHAISYSSGRMLYSNPTHIWNTQPATFKAALEQAQSIFDRAFEDCETPPVISFPDRVERVRWFLLPHEAWEYGHGRTTPVTQTTFQPKTYQRRERQTVAKSVPTKLSHVELNRNKSFRLYIREDPAADSAESDEEEGSVIIHTAVRTRVAYASTTDLDLMGTESDLGPKSPPSVPHHFNSCVDLRINSCADPSSTDPSSAVTTTNRKNTSRAKKIRKGIKAFLWPSRRH